MLYLASDTGRCKMKGNDLANVSENGEELKEHLYASSYFPAVRADYSFARVSRRHLGKY